MIMSSSDHWDTYLERTKNLGPRPLLLKTLPFVSGRRALDVGAGALNDSRYLSTLGFLVTALDRNPSIEGINVPVEKRVCSFHEYEYGENIFDLISAQGSLPFCDPVHFRSVVARIFKALAINGVFCGQFFGHLDGWSHRSDMTFLTRVEVEVTLSKLEVILLDEERYSRKKFWHVYNVIARKVQE
jgi:tellurite methyltransferase